MKHVWGKCPEVTFQIATASLVSRRSYRKFHVARIGTLGLTLLEGIFAVPVAHPSQINTETRRLLRATFPRHFPFTSTGASYTLSEYTTDLTRRTDKQEHNNRAALRAIFAPSVLC